LVDLHIHSVFSDGELIPAEISQRMETLGYKAIAITDHADFSNYRWVIERICEFSEKHSGKLKVVPGVEITHVEPEQIPELIELSRECGAKIVVVHGETPVEPVKKGTNKFAIVGRADILAHPGFITPELVELSAQKGVALEITARKGHNITNGHVVKLAKKFGAKLVINSDAHSPSDLLEPEFLKKVGLGAGLEESEVEDCFKNSFELLKRCGVEISY
jgi:histidinol phosphatase-like PHP family hydrolase